jgi:hypothetical protein
MGLNYIFSLQTLFLSLLHEYFIKQSFSFVENYHFEKVFSAQELTLICNLLLRPYFLNAFEVLLFRNQTYQQAEDFQVKASCLDLRTLHIYSLMVELS